MNEKPFQISAKDLGGLAVDGACERCFWIRRHVKPLPYQMFPGVFTILADALKAQAHLYTDEHVGQAPPWLKDYGERGRYSTMRMDWRVFQYIFPEIGAVLTGMPDDIWEPEGEWVPVAGGGEVRTNPLSVPSPQKTIIDYKVSRAKGADDPFFPVYQVQLAGYALIANSLPVESGYGPITRGALVYFDPADTAFLGSGDKSGGLFAFQASVVDVPVRDSVDVLALLRRAKRIYDLPEPPAGAPKCKDCLCVAKLKAFA